jgi:hypothetical protein
MTIAVCIHVPPLGEPFELTLPGGALIQHLDLADVLQPALTPLMPVFLIVDAIAALYTCTTAVVDALGPPPDPSKLASCIPELAEKVSKLLGLVPQLSLPLTVIGIIDLLIRVLGEVRGVLVHLAAELEAITGIVERASELDDANLLEVAGCVEASVQQEAANLGKQLASLGRLIGLTNLFLGMIGGPEIPDFSDLSGKPIQDAVAPLDQLVATLQSARRMVPVP